MAVALKNKHSPCMMCYQKGIHFNSTSAHCMSCEYNIMSKLLAKLLLECDYFCSTCKKRRILDDGRWDCPIVDGTGFSCHNVDKYELDWEAACAEYGIETV